MIGILCVQVLDVSLTRIVPLCITEPFIKNSSFIIVLHFLSPTAQTHGYMAIHGAGRKQMLYFTLQSRAFLLLCFLYPVFQTSWTWW